MEEAAAIVEEAAATVATSGGCPTAETGHSHSKDKTGRFPQQNNKAAPSEITRPLPQKINQAAD